MNVCRITAGEPYGARACVGWPLLAPAVVEASRAGSPALWQGDRRVVFSRDPVDRASPAPCGADRGRPPRTVRAAAAPAWLAGHRGPLYPLRRARLGPGAGPGPARSAGPPAGAGPGSTRPAGAFRRPRP